MRLQSLCVALFVLDAAYCVGAVFVPELPGWKMYEGSERSTWLLSDGRGRPIDAYAWVPASARDLDDQDVVQIARWLCVGRKERLPLRIETRLGQRILDAPDCVDRAVE